MATPLRSLSQRLHVRFVCWQPTGNLDAIVGSASQPLPVQAFVMFMLVSKHEFVTKFADGTQISSERIDPLIAKEARFDFSTFMCHTCSYQILSRMLSEMGVGKLNLQRQLDAVIKSGQLIGNSASNIGRKVLPLIAKFEVRTEQVIVEQASVIPRASLPMNRSRPLDYEIRNEGGMIPASKLAVRNLVKRVRIDEDEARGSDSRRKRRRRASTCGGGGRDNCCICLEEYGGGDASAVMPCSHVFHEKCIKRCLKESHYCPVCRYEMPKDPSD